MQLDRLDQLQARQAKKLAKQAGGGGGGQRQKAMPAPGSGMLERFERDALQLIETGGYMDALTQVCPPRRCTEVPGR